MSKTNISIDGIDYEISTQHTAASKDAIRTHLSNQLAGSGKTVKFDNVYYDVDIDKYTDAFTQINTMLNSIGEEWREK